MSERWMPTGRLRWVILPDRGPRPVRVLQQEWTTLTVDGWRYEWLDVPVEEEAGT